MNVLVYLRKEPLKSFYSNLASYVSGNNFTSISEFRNTGDIWLGKYLYENNESYFFDVNSAKDIYLRCRFLRRNSFEKALPLINKMANGISEIIQSEKPDIILAPIIDNYTLDILERISKKNNIPYISFVGHFFNGYSRISARGEYNYFPRAVSKQEVEAIISTLLNKGYIPFFHEKIKSSLKQKQVFLSKQLLKKHVYFPLMKIIDRDSKNYHYNTILENNNILSYFVHNNIDKYFTKISDVSRLTNNIYFPLHFTPEATVDYWCDDPSYGAFYEEKIINIIDKSSRGFNLIVKEHPAMYMLRNPRFYAKLLSYNNVTLIHPYENSNLLLDKVNYVFTENGSVGIEALIRNKIVITNSSNYYDNFHPNNHKYSTINNEILNLNIVKYENDLLIKDILQGLFKGKLINNKNIHRSDTQLILEQVDTFIKFR